jgi:integrase
MAQLLYGSGLRRMECVRLRIQDVDFEYRTITVRDGKGEKDRIVPLPETVIPELRRQIERVRLLHEEDLAARYGEVDLPDALERKYPHAARGFIWQDLFPAAQRSVDLRSGKVRRHHMDPSGLQRAVKQAAREAGIPKRATPHTLRRSLTTHLPQAGCDIQTVQERLGHKEVRTRRIDTHFLIARRSGGAQPAGFLRSPEQLVDLGWRREGRERRMSQGPRDRWDPSALPFAFFHGSSLPMIGDLGYNAGRGNPRGRESHGS